MAILTALAVAAISLEAAREALVDARVASAADSGFRGVAIAALAARALVLPVGGRLALAAALALPLSGGRA